MRERIPSYLCMFPSLTSCRTPFSASTKSSSSRSSLLPSRAWCRACSVDRDMHKTDARRGPMWPDPHSSPRCGVLLGNPHQIQNPSAPRHWRQPTGAAAGTGRAGDTMPSDKDQRLGLRHWSRHKVQKGNEASREGNAGEPLGSSTHHTPHRPYRVISEEECDALRLPPPETGGREPLSDLIAGECLPCVYCGRCVGVCVGVVLCVGVALRGVVGASGWISSSPPPCPPSSPGSTSLSLSSSCLGTEGAREATCSATSFSSRRASAVRMLLRLITAPTCRSSCTVCLLVTALSNEPQVHCASEKSSQSRNSGLKTSRAASGSVPSSARAFRIRSTRASNRASFSLRVASSSAMCCIFFLRSYLSPASVNSTVGIPSRIPRLPIVSSLRFAGFSGSRFACFF
mmetsp:Transcript_17515/g.42743  ORF Transcript_17515/g.42743 Transcript_17515/m.42743 type:complete len:401 (-) Transcript_17515:169-1371(-)